MGKGLDRALERARVLAWKRGGDWVKPWSMRMRRGWGVGGAGFGFGDGEGGAGGMVLRVRWEGGRRWEGRCGELVLGLRMLKGEVLFMWAFSVCMEMGEIVGAISAPLRRQKSALASPPIRDLVSAALLSRDLGDRRANKGDCAPRMGELLPDCHFSESFTFLFSLSRR